MEILPDDVLGIIYEFVSFLILNNFIEYPNIIMIFIINIQIIQ